MGVFHGTCVQLHCIEAALQGLRDYLAGSDELESCLLPPSWYAGMPNLAPIEFASPCERRVRLTVRRILHGACPRSASSAHLSQFRYSVSECS
jgi:hypothetical protein